MSVGRIPLAIVVSIAGLLLVACAQEAQAMGSLEIIVEGNATVSSGYPVKFLLKDSPGNAVAGETISLNVSSPDNNSAFNAYNLTTDTSGMASAILFTSTKSGVNRIVAEHDGYAGTLTTALDLEVMPSSPAIIYTYPGPTLRPADEYNVFSCAVRVTDVYDNPVPNVETNITVNEGTEYRRTAIYTDVNGIAQFTVGPAGYSHLENVSIEVAGLPQQVIHVRFLDPANIVVLDYPNNVIAGENATVTVAFYEDSARNVPAAGVPLTFYVSSKDNLATPSAYSDITDENGLISFEFKTSPRVGNPNIPNIVVVGNDDLRGGLAQAIIFGTGGVVSSLTIECDPKSPVFADGVSGYKLKLRATDAGGNPVEGADVLMVRDLATNYSYTTNQYGVVTVDIGPSIYVTDTQIEVSCQGIENSTVLYYLAGPPARTVIKAIPDVIASSDVNTPPGSEDVHTTEVIGLVTDEWYHPLPGEPIAIASANMTAGNITGPVTGTTDCNGEFYTKFTLGDFCDGMGTVPIIAQSGSISSTFNIKYTNTSFLSIDSIIVPRDPVVNESITVSISVKGMGWNNRPKPADVMLVMDRSGSMDWYADTVWPEDGTPKKGYTAPNGGYELIGTYVSTGTTPFQVMLSSPYTSYKNGSYYYLMVKDPSGKACYTRNGTSKNGAQVHHSSNENYAIFNNPKIGTYSIYGMLIKSGSDTAEYSSMIVVQPKRLGQSSDRNSAAKVAAREFVNNMTTKDQVGYVTFSTSASTNRHLSTMIGSNKSSMYNSINGTSASGGTNISSGINAAVAELCSSRARPESNKVIVILTDGYSQYPEYDKISADAARDRGIKIFTIGMGMADEDTLIEIASKTGGRYYRVSSQSELIESFNDIATNIKEVVAENSQMDISTNNVMVNGVASPDVEYVMDSAVITNTTGTKVYAPVSNPSIAYSSDRYSLTWNPGTIKLNEVWKVTYKLKVTRGGAITPILNESAISFTDGEGNTCITPLVEDSVFARDSGGPSIGPSGDIISVRISDSLKNGTAMTSLYQRIDWTVEYTGSKEYVQKVWYRKVGDRNWNFLYQGPNGTATGNYYFDWNIANKQAYNYTIMVNATDFDEEGRDERTLEKPYSSGNIILQ